LIIAVSNVAHRERRLPLAQRAREPVGVRENAAEIVGRMTPLGREPGVVEIEPADDRPDVEGGLYRVELELRARHLRAVRDDGPGTTGPSSFVQAG
jgi:hypothetical protein